MEKATHTLNVFEGADAIKNFLNPEKNPPLPLVELPDALNPFRSEGVRIFAKLMNQLPLGNVKSLPAYNMLFEEAESGGLQGVGALIENSSGNTVFSLAVIGRLFGIPRTRAIVSHEVSPGKLKILRLFGTEVLVNKEPICPDPNDRTSGIYKAKNIGQRKGWFNPGQYDNEANPRAHEKWTGPQIWEQTKGKISVFCAGLGTTGTMVGVSRYLKSRSKKIVAVGVSRNLNNPVPGVRTPNLLREIAFDWQTITDEMYQIGTQESFAKSLELCRNGLMVGPSSGFCLAGLLSFFEEKKKSNELDTLRNEDGEIIAVFLCPDSPLPYLDEYFEYLDQSFFPKLKNPELLPWYKEERAIPNQFDFPDTENFEKSPSEIFKMIYEKNPQEIWQDLESGKDISFRPHFLVIDIRNQGEFSHFHIPGARQMNPQAVMRSVSRWKKKKLVLCCQMGVRTKELVRILRGRGIEAYSLRGGLTEWSSLDLPRVRPEVCRT